MTREQRIDEAVRKVLKYGNGEGYSLPPGLVFACIMSDGYENVVDPFVADVRLEFANQAT